MVISALQNVCNVKDNEPPGRLIYKKEPYSIYEIDGEEEKVLSACPDRPSNILMLG